MFAWVGPVLKTKEHDLINQVGLDATVFLRFLRMCRNIFVVIAVLGCSILIPSYMTLANKFPLSWVMVLTPINAHPEAMWALVVCSWLFDIVIAGFLFWNYKRILDLRRQYLESPEYQNSLHARTLMLNDIPKSFRTDEGIGRLIDEVAPTSSFSRCAIARNVKELPQLIDQHNKTVRQLEKHLAKYLHNPDKLPATRPVCKPSKDDPSYGSYTKGSKVDAIEYLSGRIKDLEQEIKEVRLTIDKRNAMPYGFASYEDISEAHSIAYTARNKHPQGTTIVLAPRPNDVIWKNMPLSKSTRRTRRFINNLWVTLLTVFWIAPNTMISVFLVNLHNLGLVWPAFNTSLGNHTTWWAVVQGVASPALTSLVFLILPIIFRRLAIRAGDRTKTSRERHVTAKLYAFFVFNNLIVSNIFSALWSFISAVIKSTGEGQNAWDAIRNANLPLSLVNSLCWVSPFWVTYLLQRNLGAAVDLAQLWTLFWSFCARKFSSPTPRELIEMTAPQAFDYASYYNYFLFYATITLSFGVIQPLVLPAAALYFTLDVYLKKYLLLYIFITKTESGGLFWRTIFNRMVFAAIISNIIAFLVCFVKQNNIAFPQAYAIVPLPFLMMAFKMYCSRTFDEQIRYYTVVNTAKVAEEATNLKYALKGDRLACRFGHPALYKPLITPMVHAKSQHVLASIYRGRLSDGRDAESFDLASVSGYSDTFAMSKMTPGQPGHKAGKGGLEGFEVVPESQLDFAYFKNRPEFGDEHGGGAIYSRPTDLIDRPGTSNTFRGGYDSSTPSRTASPAATLRNPMPASDSHGDLGGGRGRFYRQGNDSDAAVPLVASAAGMPIHAPTPVQQGVLGAGAMGRAPGFLGGGPQGYGGLPQGEEEVGPVYSDTSYDFYRPAKRNNAGWQGFTG
jgi:hypothetical protein